MRFVAIFNIINDAVIRIFPGLVNNGCQQCRISHHTFGIGHHICWFPSARTRCFVHTNHPTHLGVILGMSCHHQVRQATHHLQLIAVWPEPTCLRLEPKIAKHINISGFFYPLLIDVIGICLVNLLLLPSVEARKNPDRCTRRRKYSVCLHGSMSRGCYESRLFGCLSWLLVHVTHEQNDKREKHYIKKMDTKEFPYHYCNPPCITA